AVDAAVATGFALAVTYPRAGNIGGGGFMVIHSADRGQDIAIDDRAAAQAPTTPALALPAAGAPQPAHPRPPPLGHGLPAPAPGRKRAPAKSRTPALGIGVPGTVAGLALALEKFGSGKFTLAEILKPAIALARDGFVLTGDTSDTLTDMYRRMSRWPGSAKGF